MSRIHDASTRRLTENQIAGNSLLVIYLRNRKSSRKAGALQLIPNPPRTYLVAAITKTVILLSKSATLVPFDVFLKYRWSTD